MIQTVVTHRCAGCGRENITKNGHNRCGSQQYRCKDCGKYAVLEPSVKYTEVEKAQILTSYQERPSMRGIERMFGVKRQTLAKWLKKKQGSAG